jgi:Helicase conserved C-terminal domain
VAASFHPETVATVSVWSTRGKGHPVRIRRSVCYIRRDKKQVMPELKEPIPVRVRLKITNEKQYARAEQGLIDYMDGVKLETPQTFINELARIEKLRELAVEGIMAGVEDWLEAFVQTNQKLLLFAHHIDIQKRLFEMSERILARHGEAIRHPLRTACLFSGSAKEQEKQKKLFQTDPDVRNLIGSMMVGGTGHNLTAASNIALVELPWTPSEIDQIIARAYGRFSDAHGVDVYFLTARSTIHDEIWAVLEEKRKVTTAVISGKDVETKVLNQIQREVIDRLRKRAKRKRASRRILKGWPPLPSVLPLRKAHYLPRLQKASSPPSGEIAREQSRRPCSVKRIEGSGYDSSFRRSSFSRKD